MTPSLLQLPTTAIFMGNCLRLGLAGGDGSGRRVAERGHRSCGTGRRAACATGEMLWFGVQVLEFPECHETRDKENQADLSREQFRVTQQDYFQSWNSGKPGEHNGGKSGHGDTPHCLAGPFAIENFGKAIGGEAKDNERKKGHGVKGIGLQCGSQKQSDNNRAGDDSEQNGDAREIGNAEFANRPAQANDRGDNKRHENQAKDNSGDLKSEGKQDRSERAKDTETECEPKDDHKQRAQWKKEHMAEVTLHVIGKHFEIQPFETRSAELLKRDTSGRNEEQGGYKPPVFRPSVDRGLNSRSDFRGSGRFGC